MINLWTLNMYMKWKPLKLNITDTISEITYTYLHAIKYVTTAKLLCHMFI